MLDAFHHFISVGLHVSETLWWFQYLGCWIKVQWYYCIHVLITRLPQVLEREQTYHFWGHSRTRGRDKNSGTVIGQLRHTYTQSTCTNPHMYILTHTQSTNTHIDNLPTRTYTTIYQHAHTQSTKTQTYTIYQNANIQAIYLFFMAVRITVILCL